MAKTLLTSKQHRPLCPKELAVLRHIAMLRHRHQVYLKEEVEDLLQVVAEEQGPTVAGVRNPWGSLVQACYDRRWKTRTPIAL